MLKRKRKDVEKRIETRSNSYILFSFNILVIFLRHIFSREFLWKVKTSQGRDFFNEDGCAVPMLFPSDHLFITFIFCLTDISCVSWHLSCDLLSFPWLYLVNLENHSWEPRKRRSQIVNASLFSSFPYQFSSCLLEIYSLDKEKKVIF